MQTENLIIAEPPNGQAWLGFTSRGQTNWLGIRFLRNRSKSST